METRCLESNRVGRTLLGGAASVCADAARAEIRELLGEFPKMPAMVIAERIGWERGMTVLRDRIAQLRPLFVPPDPAQRTWYRPGELAQLDLWQPDVLIPVGFGQTAKLWTVVGVAGYSRLTGAHMVPSRAAHEGWGDVGVIGEFGAVPRTAVCGVCYRRLLEVHRSMAGLSEFADRSGSRCPRTSHLES